MKCVKCGQDIEMNKKESGYNLLVPTKIHLLGSVKSIDNIKVPGIYYFNPHIKKLLKIYNPRKDRFEMVKIQPFIREWILQVFKETFVPAGMRKPLLHKDIKNNMEGLNNFWWAYASGSVTLADIVYEKGVNPLVVKNNSFVLWGNKIIVDVGSNVKLTLGRDRMLVEDKTIIRFNVLIAFYNSLVFLHNKKRNLQQFFDWLVAQRIVHSIEKDGMKLYIQGDSRSNVSTFSLLGYKKNMREFDKHFRFR